MGYSEIAMRSRVYITGNFYLCHRDVHCPHPGASATAWVGIDGDTCTGAILQTGVDFTVESGEETDRKP